ncbi:MAG TPA: histidine phosphatase family protein [Chlamydiales bacterium]|nr:histidine phosphatase family protein [Chlamydiales bacterium]
MIRLILVRHGNTFEAGQVATQVGARTDLPLTAQGRKQAEQLGDYFLSQSIRPAAIYAGTLTRQIESAEIIAQRLCVEERLKVREPSLTEIDYGAWEGLTSEEISRRWPTEYNGWTEAGEWAEGIFGGSLQSHKSNIDRWLATIRKTYVSGDVIIAVSSNGLIRFFSDEWEKLAAAKQIDKLKVKTGHFCELELHPDRLKVKSWNITPLSIARFAIGLFVFAGDYLFF